MEKITLQKQLAGQNLRKVAQESKIANIRATADVEVFNLESELEKTLITIADITAKIEALN